MYVPLPLLIAGAVVVLGLLAWAFLRGPADGRGDLTAPPPSSPQVRHGQSGFPAVSASYEPVAGPDGPTALPDELRAEVVRLLQSGHVVGAVKLVRDRTGLGLRESKDLVDAMRRDDVTFR